jgi:hypothetical protein
MITLLPIEKPDVLATGRAVAPGRSATERVVFGAAFFAVGAIAAELAESDRP